MSHPHIEGVHGFQVAAGEPDYDRIRYQYATSSFEDENRMSPALVVQASSKEDIAIVIKYAKAKNISVAIRTGGHQYSGASSTEAPNIQLDLSSSFRGPDDLRLFNAPDLKTYVRTSVSWTLGEFNAWMGQHKLFVPHGFCINVHLGGHVVTGGYGQLGRSFGLFGDHVVSIEFIDHNGDFQEVTRDSDPEMFYALLGGSPGNLGVITHFIIQVYHDDDYVGSRGLKALYLYKPKTVKKLLTHLATMSDNPDFPRNYGLCVAVQSDTFNVPSIFPEADALTKEQCPAIYDKDGNKSWPATILVFAHWVPLSPYDRPDNSWFEAISKAAIKEDIISITDDVKPVSQLTADWIMREIREFNLPYIRRSRLSNSTTLVKDNWPEWLMHRMDDLISPSNGCYISSQILCYGGKYSKFRTNANNGTSFSWRDSNVLCNLDAFYDGEAAQQTSIQWHKRNDEEGVGPNGIFSKPDRRVLFGSFGEFDLNAVWDKYFETREKYDRLRVVRRKADPGGVFTPNKFSVRR